MRKFSRISRVMFRSRNALAPPAAVMPPVAGAFQRERQMRRLQTAFVLAAILVATVGPGALGKSGDRDNSSRAHACTNETLQGTYGIQIQGTQPAGPGGPIESVIGVIIRDYDGFGQFTQVGNVKGSITPWTPDRVGGGTYDVAADCTAVVHLHPGPGIVVEERLIIVDSGREVRSAAMLPAPVMVTGVARRLHRD